MIKIIKFIALPVLAITVATTMSCKKVLNNSDDGGNTDNNIDITTPDGTSQDKLYDSIYLYALQTYYWNTQLPTYKSFNPRGYENANDSLGLANEIFAFTRYPKDASGNLYEQRIKFDENTAANEPDNSEPKYSQIYYSNNSFTGNAGFIPNVQFGKEREDATLDGKDSGLGMIVSFVPADYYDDSTYLINNSIAKSYSSYICVVRYVVNGSPAQKAGINRGDIIAKLNDLNIDFGTTSSPNETNINYVGNSIYYAQSAKLSVYKSSNKEINDYSLNAISYNFNPIFKSEVLSYGSHKIAYLAFLSFIDPSIAKPVLDSAFASYSSQGATDIIVDLRYNGGGYVATAEDLINYLVPSSANNSTMYTEYYNQTMVNGKATLLSNIPQDYDNLSRGQLSKLDFSPSAQTTKISKAGNLDLKKVYFIVSSGTASASELVINSVKPYSTVTQINSDFSDTSSFTYGKPVGFFEIRVGKFSMWIPNFETKNANNEGGYYQGIKSDYREFDDITHDFGDPKEYCLADMIYLISGVDTYQTNGKSLFANQRSLSSMSSKTISTGNVYRVSNMIGKPKRIFK
ncbi:MAG: S41 family peptidase [Arachidicoccus sp.]|nr:S41 family peptidase [Arachidicoccus sp.]